MLRLDNPGSQISKTTWMATRKTWILVLIVPFLSNFIQTQKTLLSPCKAQFLVSYQFRCVFAGWKAFTNEFKLTNE